MRRMSTSEKTGFRERLAQLRMAFVTTKQVDDKLVPLIIGVPLAVFIAVAGGLLLLGMVASAVVAGLVSALLAALIVFGRRATRAQFDMLEGRAGAAAAVLQSMRGRWRVTPAVAFTRKQDFVHRVIGRPGVVLVGEGSRARVTQLLKQEKRRVSRAAGDVPVHEVSVGEGQGQVALDKLQTHLARLPRAIRTRQIGPLDTRLSALNDQNLPIPKGPLPRQVRGKMR